MPLIKDRSRALLEEALVGTRRIARPR